MESNEPLAQAEDDSLPANRFELELEFVQCLASPNYLHHLACSGLLSDPAFLAFLRYLSYWKRPEYVRYIAYPHALHFLDLLTSNERFRREIANVAFRNFVHEQQYYAWQNRARVLYGGGLQKGGNDEKGEGGVDSSATNAGNATGGGGESHEQHNQPTVAEGAVAAKGAGDQVV